MKGLKLLLLLVLCGLSATVAIAKPIYLANEGWVEASDPMVVNGKKVVRYTIRYAEAGDMWHPIQVMFCADARRDGCDSNAFFNAVSTEGLVRTWDVPFEVIQWGQSGTNWGNEDVDPLMLGIPDCRNLHVGKNLRIARSLPDPDIKKSGGHYLLYVGPGAPYVPGPDDLLSDDKTKVLFNGTGVCSGSAVAVARYALTTSQQPAPQQPAPQAQVAPALPATATPAPAQQPAQAAVVPTNTGSEVKFASVPAPVSSEPTKAIAKKGKKDCSNCGIKADTAAILTAIGKPMESDAEDFQTVNQKLHWTYNEVHNANVAVGTPKDGKTTLHDKQDQAMEKLNNIERLVTPPPAKEEKGLFASFWGWLTGLSPWWLLLIPASIGAYVGIQWLRNGGQVRRP